MLLLHHTTIATVFLATVVYCDFMNLGKINERVKARDQPQLYKRDGESTDEFIETHYFEDQRIDHFDIRNNATFKQRYHVNSKYYNKGNPVFLVVGGEDELRSTSVSWGAVTTMAMKQNAMVVGLEHRFYGVSHPFPNKLSPENMKFLSSAQALHDIAFFIQKYSSLDPRVYANAKWVIVGGSYPGNLAAWFRLKFPHMVVGAWASSAPVTAMSDFWMYDVLVAKQLNEDCANYIRSVTQELDALFEDQAALDIEKNKFHPKMSVDVPDNVAFMYILADTVAYAVQYDNPGVGLVDKLCSGSSKGTVDAFAEYVAYFFEYAAVEPTEMDMTSYTSESTSDPTQYSRQWMWQLCTEFAYWQITPPKAKIKGIRSKHITTAWHDEVICQGIFKFPPGYQAPVAETNAVYGGRKILKQSSKIIFTNGSRDPWRFLGVDGNSVDTTDEAEIEENSWLIEGMAHTGDLRAVQPDDSEELTAARALIAEQISQWLKG